MKKNIVYFLVLFTNPVFSQNSKNTSILNKNENYIHSRVYLEETQETNAAKKQLETVAYYDGLGRPKQNIGVKTSPKGRDVVTHIEYDEFGRQAKDFLPIPQSGTQAGKIYDSPLSNASSIYGNEKIFSEKILENSPLNRLLGQIHQGNDWQNHPIRIEYEANTTSDRVKKFKTVTQWNGGVTLSSLSQEGVFSPSSLYKNIAKDEDGNTSIEFKNGQGQVVLVRKFNGSETADTYYIYNEYNQLAFVISPLAAEKANLTQDDLDRLCYQYRYDGKGRLVEKKLPAKGWEYMVYDKLDRLTMSQDAGQRAKKEWLFTRYDRFGRVAYTGIATGESRAVEQANLNLTLSNHVERTSNAGFTQNNMKVYYNPAIGGEISYPKNIKKLLSVNYYDEYPPDAPAAPENILGQPLMASATAGGKSTKSLPLAVYLKNIENDDWSRTFTYYDQKARVIGTLHHNYLVGYTQIQMELNFAGVVQKTHTYHKRDPKSPEVKIEERFVYDHQNRLVKHFHKINGKNEELLLENIYDELGRLSKKKVGGSEGSPLQEVDYAYNIRGWLTSVNQPQNLGKDLFGFELKYQNPVSNGKDTPKYNGNISQMDWKTRSNNEELRRYTYQYDDLNRLTKSFYSKPLAVQPNTGSYDEYLSYDVNGNIKTLSRFGDMDKPQAVKIDELSYTYIGNQLVKVSDNSQNPSGYPIGGGVIPYDENGNMMNHKDKGISYIGYNHLNLPSAVFWNGKQTFYLYRADGVKVKKDFPGKVTDYLDGFQYENGALQFVPTAEGYYDFVKQRYVYNYTDHLGNVRLSYAKNNNAALEILEENNYYAFGLKHKGYGSVNLGNPNYHYKYNGKELQENSMYDYGARLYMPEIGRWNTIDPLAEKTHDPYSYVWNNPMKFLDPDGRAPMDDYRYNRDGSFTLLRKTDDNYDRVYNSDGTKSIEIQKGIINDGIHTNTSEKRFLGFLWKEKDAYKGSTYISSNVENLKSLYRLIKDNTDVEYSLNVFELVEGNIQIGALSTSYEKSRESQGVKVINNILTKMPHMKQILDSHIHPRGTAVASGFKQSSTNYDYVPNIQKKTGDLYYRKYLERKYPGRIPNEAQIALPNTSTKVYYNSKTMRIVTPKLEVGNIE